MIQLFCTHPLPSIDIVIKDEIPADLLELAQQKRAELIETLADVDEEIGDLVMMDETPNNEQLANAVRRSTIALKFSPVFMGSAVKNTAVQPLLDGVCAYLPNPSETTNVAHDTEQPIDAPPIPLHPAANAPLVGLAFKLEEGRFGQLTYMRVYQGNLKRANVIYNARTGKRVKVPRLVRMHSNEMEDIDSIGPGEICAIFGVECSSGDTFTDGTTSFSMVRGFDICFVFPLTSPAGIHVCSGACHLTGSQTRWERNSQLFQGAE